MESDESSKRKIWLKSLNSEFRYRGDIQFIDASTGDSISYFLKALDQVSLGEYSDAIEYFNKAIDLDPKWGRAWYYKGLLSKLLGYEEVADLAFAMVKQLGFDENVPIADIEQCFRALRDENISIRLIATDIFRELKFRPAVLSLIHALQYDDNSGVRWKAADALGHIRDPIAMDPLIRALKDEDYNVRGYAALALGRFGVNGPIAPLIPILRDENYRVRGCAAEALGSIGGIESANLLLQALEYEEDYEVRIDLANSIHSIIKNDPDVREYLKNHAIDLLIRALCDEDGSFRSIMDLCLISLKDSRALKARESYFNRDRGCLLISEGKYEEAIECFNTAIDLDSSDACSWYHKGVVLGILGFYQESIQCFNKAIRLRSMRLRLTDHS